ncbi:MAG: energy transducer TonB, partial [Candidatus Aminicenantes bacterium]|nr:energy transducer TonB [Candidatus Aminicenantes bacterium]
MTAHAAAILAAFWFFGTEIPQPAFQVDSVALEKGTFNIRIFEGATGSGDLPSLTSISSFAQAGAGDQGGWEEDPEAQATRIQKAYNLKSVAIIGSGSITLEKGDRGPAYVKLHIPNKVDLSLEFTVTDPSARKFLIEVFEQNEDVRSNILSTEVGLPKATYTIFGFKDLRNNPYFVALQIGEWTVIPAGPVRRIGPDVQPPKLIHRVEPEFPIKAREARVEGTVVLEAQTDIYGRVLSVKVLKSIPLLDQAAIDAVRQWVYEPMLVNGNPQGVVFTVTVRFTLENEKPKPAKERIPPVPDKGPVRAIGQIKPPALRKQVKPVYPE